MNDILETLKAEGSFQTLLALLGKADLTGALKENGPLTFFAPNDAAFTRVNIDEISADVIELGALLTYHMVPGKFSSGEIADNEHLDTRNGKALTVQMEAGEQVIDNAKYVKADIACSNGILHVIDNVYLPRMSGWYCGGCC